MKYLWIAAGVSLLLFSACGQIDVQEDAKLAALRSEIAENGAQAGAAYLGYAQESTAGALISVLEEGGFEEIFPFLRDLPEDHIFLQEGCEVYLLLPAGEEEPLTVWEYRLEEEPVRGERLGTFQDGKPVLLCGNVSEVVPNFLLEIGEMEYSPCLSGMDGSLVTAEGVCDLTPYDLVEKQWQEMQGQE